MDTDGDLSLKVGDTKCVTFSLNGCDSDHCDPDSDHEHELPVIYIVCSKTLSRASPVWKALLYGGFAESKPLYASSASDWVVELPDDNPKAMATILNIIHSRFESTPRATEPIDLEDLYQLAVLTDKYDLTATLRPWVSAWMEYAREEYEQLKRQEADFLVSHLERLSWISWEMGDAYLYEKVSQDLAHRCSVDVNGHLQYEIGDEMVPLFNSTLEPPGHRDELKVIRLNYIKNALAIYEDAVAQLFKPPRSLLPATIYRSLGLGTGPCQQPVMFEGTSTECVVF
ncbi:hypothetical protein E0Z10_g7115 [Xylaria hypoxylon]|uniref:BTB domain-containing protein n=1 Tax=Xylaria hypoxylon TaxID=37992 RepID=A0A4Z0YT89_9PEZI|nr:hypothetical protein E0Z10_g7115 [Xylaria hypoxylon]